MQSLADSFDPTVMVTHRDLKWLELKMQPILMEAEALECKFQRLEEQCQKQQPEMVTGLKKESPKSHTSGAVSHAPEVPKPVVRPSVISYEPLLDSYLSHPNTSLHHIQRSGPSFRHHLLQLHHAS